MTALRILYVDDESDLREIVEISLGIDPELVTRSCASGKEALELVVEWPPDVIILDVMMPAMDGPATFACLRKNAETVNVPVIFMTARAQCKELEHFKALGAAGVIAKPFDPMTLASTVRSCLRSGDKALQVLRNMFLQRIADEAIRLKGFRSELLHAVSSLDLLTEIRAIAHCLAGACGIYGFPDVGDAAAALEEMVISPSGASPTIEEVTHALDHLITCITSVCSSQRALNA